MNKVRRGMLCAVASAVCFGLNALLTRNAASYGVSPRMLVFFRGLFTALVLAVPAIRKGDWSWIRRDCNFAKSFGLGMLGFVLTPVFLLSSYSFIDSGTATALHFCYPLLIFLLEVIFYKARAGLGSVLCIAACSIGIVLLTDFGGAGKPIGYLIALGSGIVYSLYGVLMERTESLAGVSTLTISFVFNLVTIPVVAAYCIITGEFRLDYPVAGFFSAFLFAMMAGVGGSLLFQEGIRCAGSRRSAILSTFEPLTSIIIGITVYSEPLTLRNCAGFICILAAGIMLVAISGSASDKA